MIQGDHGAVSLKHRPWNITASTPNAIANYLCWAQFSLRFWHFWWVSSLFRWSPTISKPVLSISLIVGRLYIRILLTTRGNTLAVRDGEGFMEVAMLLHVLMFWGLLARPAGRSDWPVENYPVRTSRVMRKAGAARRRLAEKLCCQAPPGGETDRLMPHLAAILDGCSIRSQMQLFLDGEGIDNVTLRLWKFSDFCSRHTVGVAGDDIMYHILVSS